MIRDGWENLNFEDALNAEEDASCSQIGAWGWRLCGCRVIRRGRSRLILDSFERVLLLLFEEDIVAGQATGKVLDFLNLDSFPKSPGNIHANVSGYPKNRWVHRMMTDELIGRKIKNAIKATPLYASSKRLYHKMMKVNLKKEEMAPKTREMLKERFQEDVALLAERTKIPVQKFWTDFQ